ncbi:MAG: HD domain-containing protein [Myxococcota bacterium]
MPLSSWSPESYLAAYNFAARAHVGQTVPGSDGLPYLVHLGTVCMEVMNALVRETCENPDLAIQCALLHDTVEDTAVTHDDLVARFGHAVADGVRALSKDPALPKAERMADSLRRIREQPGEVWMVKLADRITNLQPPPVHWTGDRRRRYRDEAMLIVDRLGSASPVLKSRLCDKIAAYQAHIDSAPQDG